MPVKSTRITRIDWLLFAAAWLAFGFFHQGGGWNQNGRFAMVRAVVEAGRLDVDETLVYYGFEEGERGPRLLRVPVSQGAVRAEGRTWVLAWTGSPPVGLREPGPGERLLPVDRAGASGDVAWGRGHLHPNKAPGAALLAVPGYLLLHRTERAFGLDPDEWWVLTVNAWLATVLSVGLVSALACVLFRRTALRLWPGAELPATAAAATFAFGTIFFPYATMLYDHNVAAAGLLASFLCLERARDDGDPHRRLGLAAAAGFAAGWAAISSYVAAVPLALLAATELLPSRDRPRSGRRIAGFAAGAAVPLAIAALYHQLCYGSPFTTAYAHQNPLFRESGALLQVLGWPRADRLFGVLVSPVRGLFFSSPVLLVAALGLVAMARDPARRRPALLFSAIFASLLLFNVSFNGWHGGWGVGPRYLIPALPFLALPLTWGYLRLPRTTAALAILSALVMTAYTSVDPQPPVGVSPIAERPDRAPLLREPLTEYVLPLFVTGRAGPILDARRAAGESDRELAAFQGPVSVGPGGVYEGWSGRIFAKDSSQAAWNAFNAGELLFPGSRLSLLPLLAPLLLVAAALRAASRHSR